MSGFEDVDKRFEPSTTRLRAMQANFDVLTDGVRSLRIDTEARLQAVTATLKNLVEQLHSVRADVVKVHELRARLVRFQKKSRPVR